MNNIDQSQHVGVQPRRVAVDVVSSLTEQEFNDGYYNKKPVLIKGALKDSRACRLWSLDYLRSKAGNRVVKFAYNEGSNFSDAIKGIKWLDGSLSEILDLISIAHSENPFFAYMGQQSIPEYFPELLPDLERPPFIRESDYFGDNNIWIGPAGCRAGLHYDNYHNFFCQIKGRKEIALFSPEDSPNLYSSKLPGMYRVSEVEISNVDQEKFPLFANAVDVHCIVEAGDMLYMPFGWWHDILTVELSVSVNFWWQRFDVPEKGIKYLEVHEISAIISYFLHKGFSVNHTDQDGEYLLIKAITNRYPQIVQALLQLGADPNVSSRIYRPGVSAFSMASESGQQKIVDLLRSHGYNN